MGYLVDGNNLIGRSRELNLKDPRARARLVRELAQFARARRSRVTVVFDGEPDPACGSRQLGTLTVRFSGAGREADDVILDILGREADPAGTIVVTSDRSLADRARHAGARTVRSGPFRRKLHEPREGCSDTAPDGLTKDEIEDWINYFSGRDTPSG